MLRTGAIAGTSGKTVPWGGGTPGANTILLPFLPDDHVLIVLANMDLPVAMAIGERIRGWLGGAEPTRAR